MTTSNGSAIDRSRRAAAASRPSEFDSTRERVWRLRAARARARPSAAIGFRHRFTVGCCSTATRRTGSTCAVGTCAVRAGRPSARATDGRARPRPARRSGPRPRARPRRAHQVRPPAHARASRRARKSRSSSTRVWPASKVMTRRRDAPVVPQRRPRGGILGTWPTGRPQPLRPCPGWWSSGAARCPIVQAFRIPESGLVIGRELLENTTDDRISRQHARVMWRDKRFVVTDLGSRNGTYAGGHALVDREVTVTAPSVVRTGRTVSVLLDDITRFEGAAISTQHDAIVGASTRPLWREVEERRDAGEPNLADPRRARQRQGPHGARLREDAQPSRGRVQPDDPGRPARARRRSRRSRR